MTALKVSVFYSVWEISTRRCLRTLQVGDAVQCVAWNPNTRVCLLAVAVGSCVVMINPETYLTDKVVVTRTNALFEKAPEQGDYIGKLTPRPYKPLQ